MTTHNPPSVAEQAANAGRWVAQIAAFFRKHPQQDVHFGVRDGHAYIALLPTTEAHPALTAHQRLACGETLHPDALARFLTTPKGYVSFYLQGPKRSGYGARLRGEVDVGYGKVDIVALTGRGWDEIAQTLALVVCATADDTPLHHAFLYGILGPETGGGTIHPPSVKGQMERAAKAILAQQAVGHSKLALPQPFGKHTQASLSRALCGMAETVLTVSQWAHHSATHHNQANA